MELTKEIVRFRDGSSITVSEESWDIGEKLAILENELAKERPNLSVSEWGRRILYNKMAACSSGDVPTEEEAKNWPSEELDKWYLAVRRINPRWFVAIDALMSEKAEVEKKTRKRRK